MAVATFSGKIFNTEQFKKLTDRSGFIKTVFQVYFENKGIIDSIYKAYNPEIEFNEADALRFYITKSSELLNNKDLVGMFQEDMRRHKEGVVG